MPNKKSSMVSLVTPDQTWVYWLEFPRRWEGDTSLSLPEVTPGMHFGWLFKLIGEMFSIYAPKQARAWYFNSNRLICDEIFQFCCRTAPA